MTDFITKDSGQRQEFTTGAQRDVSSGKGRYDLIPRAALHRLAQLFERGAVKYAARNWEKGMPLSKFMDSGLRHAFQANDGQVDEDHLIAAAWNFLCAAEIQERVKAGKLPKDLDDLPYQSGEKK